MPTSVIAAIAADAIGTFVADAVIFDIAAATTLDWVTTYAVIQAGTSFVASSLIKSALSGGAESAPTSSPSFTAQAEARTHIIRSAVANRQVVYGKAMVSGPLVFAVSDIANKDLHLIVALAGHEIDAVEQVYFNDTLSSDSLFSGYETITAHLGAADQLADADLVAAGLGWTADHRLRGVAYLYIKLTYSRDVYPRGIPNIKAVIRGKKLYDPRTATTAWSDNLALAVRDYLTATYGLAAPAAEIDDGTLIAAANICDEAVALAAGGTEARYTVNGVLDTGSTPRANMEALLSGCGGALTWPAGLWTLHVGAYVAPTLSLNESDFAGPVQIRTRVTRQNLFNAIKGTYVDPGKYWQPGDFTPVTNSLYAAQDRAQIFRDVALPVTTSNSRAQRLAKMMVEKSRQGITVQGPLKLTAFKAGTWDNLYLSLPQPGWTNKVFKVTSWAFNESGNINLTLQEEAASCYTWAAEETVADPAPDTNLPDPFSVTAPATPIVVESLFGTTGSAGVKARATMSWVKSADSFVVDYLPEYRVAGGTWIMLPATTALSSDINDIAPGSYEFRLRARNTMGISSPYSIVTAKEILGLTAPPSAVTSFSVIASNGVAIGDWALSPDLDVRIGGRIVVRWTPLTAGAVWENGIDVGEFNGDAVGGLLPMLTGTYLAKAKDSSGNWSATAASFTLTAGNLTALLNSLIVTEHPTFLGTKNSVAVDAGSLKLDGATLIDSMAALIDSWGAIDTLGGVASVGTYDFVGLMDFGSVVTRRITPNIQALAFDAGDLIDSRGFVDDWDSVDGGVINDATVQLLAAISTDAVSYGAWFPFPAGDVTCRSIKFRLALASAQPTHNIGISQLSVTANW